MAKLIRNNFPKNLVARSHFSLPVRTRVCIPATRNEVPMVIGTKKKWYTVVMPNCHCESPKALMLIVALLPRDLQCLRRVKSPITRQFPAQIDFCNGFASIMWALMRPGSHFGRLRGCLMGPRTRCLPGGTAFAAVRQPS